MMYLLPQLPCKNRYTEDWIKIWSRELVNLGTQFKVLGGSTPVPITKFFTDPNQALQYECNQLKTLVASNPEKIFCLDVDFPGLLSSAIPALKLMNPKLKCYGYLHAGSWCNGDIWTGIPGKKQIERAMFDTFDKIFVASWYHKSKIQWYFNRGFSNLQVVGFPFYKRDVLWYVVPQPFEEKDGIIVNGRWEQSNRDLLDRLRKKLNVQFHVIEATNREGYYKQLNTAKVVLSLKTEETFGIGQLEAYVLGGIPLSPNRYAYPEVIGDERLLYKNEEDLVDKLAYLLELKENPFQIDIEKYEQVIPICMRKIIEDDKLARRE